MSTAERRALLTLLGLVVAGHGVRLWLLRPGDAPGGVRLIAEADSGALARHRAAAATAGRPLAPGERLDLNTASASELTRLPKVGPGLARRIVAHRESQGPFRSLADLDRVTGVGPAILQSVREWVVQAQPGGRESGGTTAGALVGGGARAGPGPGPDGAPGRPLNLNTATEAELLRLPGLGPTRARSIVAYRQSRGPFASVEELLRVPGIGPSTLARLAGAVGVH